MMTMHANGTRAAEDEAVHYSVPEATEWETHESHYSNPEYEFESGYSSPEMHEWESPEIHETHYSNAYSGEAELGNILGAIGGALGLESEFEDYSTPEAEWEDESAYSMPEAEWESHESAYSNPYSNAYSGEFEDESDQFFGFLAPLAAKALPLIGRAVLPLAKRLIPVAKQAVGRVIQNTAGGRPLNRAAISALLRQLSGMLAEGETESTELEAQLFGANEFEGELAAHEQAHEAALTEVLAAEAAHTESESEAEALLGAALPITIRIMSGGGATRQVMPTLVRANARLVRSLRRSGASGPQLLRTVPAIQRRTVASLRAAQRAGRPVTPALASKVMAAQAARVLATPHQCGRAIVRNASIRRGTVAPAGRRVQPRRLARPSY